MNVGEKPVVPRRAFWLIGISVVGLTAFGWYLKPRTWNDSKVTASRTASIEDLPHALEVFETVFWEPLDTESLRELLRETPSFVANKSVLEIGTGSGVLGLCCFRYGADKVVGTDLNPNAIACAKYNADRLGYPLDVRQVGTGEKADSSAYAILEPEERFDVILSNPPWEKGQPQKWSDYALYDPNFKLLRSIISDARSHLNPGGKILLAYGCVEAIQCVHRLAEEFDYDIVVLDDRDLDSLPPVFLPGMLLGLSPKPIL